MTKPITSTTELGRHLGLSRWAVSRAINGQSGVSAETVALVRAAMKEHRFVPNPHGRGLRGQRTGTIGLCFRALNTPITVEKISQVQRLVSDRGYRPLIELTEIDQRRGQDVIDHFLTLHVEGVILIDMPPSPETAAWLRLLREKGIPAVMWEPLEPPAANAVYLDRSEAMAQVTERLIDLGHSRFGLLGISREFRLGVPRCDGIERALVRRGLSFADAVATFDAPDQRYQGLKYGRELAEGLLRAGPLPSALLALNDEVAAGALWRLQQSGLQAPKDFSLFGFDNLPVSQQTQPALCTVDHQVEESAAAVVELLFKLMDKGAGARLRPVQIPPKLILRESIAAVKSRSR